MSHKTILYLFSFVLFSLSFLIVLNTAKLFSKKPSTLLLSANDVRGMAVAQNGKLYTLNFSEQNRVIEILNRSKKMDFKPLLQKEKGFFGYNALYIYLFKKPIIKVEPIALKDLQLVFKVGKSLFYEVNPGELDKLLSNTYDTP